MDYDLFINELMEKLRLLKASIRREGKLCNKIEFSSSLTHTPKQFNNMKKDLYRLREDIKDMKNNISCEVIEAFVVVKTKKIKEQRQ